MSNCLKYPSIDQFRNIIRNIKNKASFGGLDPDGHPIYNQVIFPSLRFFGTVKLHGTNASVRQDAVGQPYLFQSRERVITPIDDNAGFATYMTSLGDKLDSFIAGIREFVNAADSETVTVYGEWCGGNIQKGIAISGMEKMFMVFAIRIGTDESTKWIRADYPEFARVTSIPFAKVYSIADFETFGVDVDFNAPELSQNTFVDLTIAVETECPVGKNFGVSGIGEGIVWHCITPGWEDSGYVFKVKGEKHSASKVKTVASVDVEKVTKLKELVEVIMTENRLEQMIAVMKDKHGLDTAPQNLGTFIKTCLDDAYKEEMDTIISNGFEPKEFAKAATTKIRNFYLSLNTRNFYISLP